MNKKTLETGEFLDVLSMVIKSVQTSWNALVINIITYLQLILVPLVLFWLITLAMLSSLPDTGDWTLSSVSFSASMIALSLVLTLILLASLAVIVPAVIATQLASVRGKKITARQALDATRPQILRFVGLGLVATAAIVVGLILLIIPAFIVAFFLSYAAYILIDKNVSITDSINQSIELAKKYWKATLSMLIVSLLISFIQYFPFIGGLISFGLSVAYFCLYPVIYNVIQSPKQTGKATQS